MDGFSRSNIFSILFLFNIFNDFRPKNGLKEIVEKKTVSNDRGVWFGTQPDASFSLPLVPLEGVSAPCLSFVV